MPRPPKRPKTPGMATRPPKTPRDAPRERAELARTFEGPEVLARLLAEAGCPLEVEEVAALIQEAQEGGDPPSEVFPALFEGEPRFRNPEHARQLFENLYGLWDLIESGAPLAEGASFPQKAGPTRPKREKKEPPPPPGRYGAQGPDEEWVESAWRYLEGLDQRGTDRLTHAFENRQDALLGFLDDEQLADEGYGLARHLLFELFAMIELGAPKGAGVADPDSADAPFDSVPPALRRYVEEALLEAEQDELAAAGAGGADPLSGVRQKVERGLVALWAATAR